MQRLSDKFAAPISWRQRRGGPILRLAAICGMGAVPLFMHVTMETGRWALLSAALGGIELLLVSGLVLSGLRPLPRLLAVGTMLIAAFATLHSLRCGVIAASGIDHALIYSALLAMFGRSLISGKVDLVTDLATLTQGRLAPEMARYTRAVTKAWCLFFAAELAMSAVLFLFASRGAWSLFVNVLDLPLLALMFGAEYLCRRIVLRHLDHVGIVQSIRAFGQRHHRVAVGADAG